LTRSRLYTRSISIRPEGAIRPKAPGPCVSHPPITLKGGTVETPKPAQEQ